MRSSSDDLATTFPGFTAERAAQGEAMWRREGARLSRLALFPVLAGPLSLLSLAMLTLFFSGAGLLYGIAADFLAVGLALCLIMTAHALRIVQADRAPELGMRTTYFGMIAALLLAASSSAVLAKAAAFLSFPEPSPGTGPLGLSLIGSALVGIWLLVAGCSGRSNWVISRALIWNGVIAGILLVATSGLFAALGPLHSATVVAYLGGGVLLSAWAIWLGLALARGETGWRAATATLLEPEQAPSSS